MKENGEIINAKILYTISTDSDLAVIGTQEELSKRVQDVMEKKGITAYKLAQLCDLSVNTIYGFLNCEKDTSFSKIEKIDKALEIRIWVEK